MRMLNCYRGFVAKTIVKISFIVKNINVVQYVSTRRLVIKLCILTFFVFHLQGISGMQLTNHLGETVFLPSRRNKSGGKVAKWFPPVHTFRRRFCYMRH